MADSKDVLIFAELQDGSLARITAELAGVGQRLAGRLGQELSAVLMGAGVRAFAQELICLGATRVYVMDDPILAKYQGDSYVAAATHVCQEVSPEVVLFGQTYLGRDLAPRLAFRLNTGLAADCIDLSIDEETKVVQMTRPVYGGNAYGVFIVEGRPQMATIRARTQEPAERDFSRRGEIIDLPVQIEASSIKGTVIDSVREEMPGVKLEDASVIVAGGRGVGGADGFKKLEELARLLGGTVGASRAAVDAGWVPREIQIGQTAKVVGPNLYIAVGISGAMQHIAGCLASETIVAINRDPEAPIFRVAHYGVIGDWKQILPAFIEKCKALQEQ